MIRRALTLLWLLFPVGVLTYHFNYGQEHVQRERAVDHLQQILALEAAPEDQRDWAQIIAEYEALEREVMLIASPEIIHQIRLARTRPLLETLEIATAITELTALLQETAVMHGEHAPITRSVREMLGKAHYYATCLLQAINAPEAEWRPFAERSRQLFRFLAEHENPGATMVFEQRIESELQRVVHDMNGRAQ